MSVELLTRASKESWKQIAAVCEDAAVFLDGDAAEHLHWAGGMGLLGRCVGAYDLYEELGPVARDYIALAPYCHVVIVVTSFLHGACSEAISRVLSSLQPLECHLFCAMSEALHAEWIPMPSAGEEEEEEGEGERGREGESGERGGRYSHYGEFQALMRKWISRESGVRVSVSPISLFQCEVCPGLFITPTFSSLCPLLPSDTVHIQAKLIQEGDTATSLDHLEQVEMSMLSHELQTKIRVYASSLSDLLGELNVREDIFSLGSTSRLIAHQLAGMPQARIRRKNATSRCSVLLIDRSLDVAGPAFLSLHESLADRILSTLPHLASHSTDVAVSLSPIVTSVPGAVLPGCLAQPKSPKALSLLKTLIFSRPKEAMMEVSRCLLDALSQEGLTALPSGSRMGRPSAQQFRGFLEQFKEHSEAAIRQLAVLQLGCAVVQTLERGTHWEELVAMEKMLMASIGEEEGDSVIVQLTDLARKQLVAGTKRDRDKGGGGGEEGVGRGREEKGSRDGGSMMSLVELLSLAVCTYSLVGEACGGEEEEQRLREVLADLIALKRDCDVEFIEALGISESFTRGEVLGRLRSAFETLESLGAARDQLKQFRGITRHGELGPQKHHSLVAQVADAIFSPGRPDLPDLQLHSHGFTDILKSSFSLFMSSARPRPNNHPLLLIIVVGGVTCTEVKQIREAVAAHHSNTQVVVVSSRLLTPSDLTTLLLAKGRLRT